MAGMRHQLARDLRGLFLGKRMTWPHGRRVTLVLDSRANGPRSLATADGVTRFVFDVPGAIGMIRLADLDHTVKALTINGIGPADPHPSLVMGGS